MSQETLIILSTSFGSAAAGALLGSLSAFGLGLLQHRKERVNREHGALLNAQYALISQWNSLEGIKRQYLNDFKQDNNRFLKLPVFSNLAQPSEVPFQDLSFVVASKNPQLYQEIHIAQQSYQTAIDTIRFRNKRMEDLYDSNDYNRLDFDFETGHGRIEVPPQIAFLLKQATNNMYESIDRAVPLLLKSIDDIEQFTKNRFRKRKALKLEEIKDD